MISFSNESKDASSRRTDTKVARLPDEKSERRTPLSTGINSVHNEDSDLRKKRAGGRNELKAVGRWFRELPDSKREAIRNLHDLKPSRNAIAILFMAMWAGEGYLMHTFPYVPVRVVCYVLIGFHIHGLANLMHEAVHGNFFRRRRLDRWCGFLLGAPALVSGTAFRVVHLQHHRYNRSEHDPDEISSAVKNSTLRQIAFYAWLVAGMFYYVLIRLPLQAWALGDTQERRQLLVEYALLLLLYGSIFAVAAHQNVVWSVLHAWIFPAIFTGFFANVRGAAEHMLTEPGHPLTQSRTVTSTWLLCVLNVNLNYHLEHHLFPGMPWYNLPKLHAMLQEEYEEAGSFIYDSYLRFIVDALQSGVHGTVRER